jgi:hypothetical protein
LTLETRLPHSFNAWRTLVSAVAVVIGAITCTVAEPIAPRYQEGALHGFLALRDLDGRLLANGESVQVAESGRVTNHLVFQFTDGSSDDETTVFSQHTWLRLLSYHLIQKGRSFPHPLDLTINARTGDIRAVSNDDQGRPVTTNKTVTLPPDVSNGMIMTVLAHAQPAAFPLTLSYVTPESTPHVVALHITQAGTPRFSAGSAKYSATDFLIKVEIGGLRGSLAKLAGKEPPDSHVWIYGGKAPVFLRADLPFFVGAPSWRIELAPVEWH